MMTRRAVLPAVLAAAVLVSGLSLAAPTAAIAAESVTVGPVAVSHAWARASAGAARNGGAFMTIENTGGEPDRLLSASAEVSQSVELHTHIKDGDVMRMRQVPAIDLPAGETVTLQPGGLHVMFMGLSAPLEEGATFPLTLSFEKAGEATVTVTVQGPGAMGADMGHMGHGDMKKAD